MEEKEVMRKLHDLMLSEDLEELQLKTNKFNIFKTLNIINKELKHSDFLGWLLTPYENHGLGNYFFKEFLKSAIRNFANDNNISISLTDIYDMNFSDVEIVREREENIDILIKSKNDNFICIIENKIGANESVSNLENGEQGSQLTKYADYIYENYKKYKKLFIFLAPNTDEELIIRKCNKNEKKEVCYIPISYKQVYEVINKVLKFQSQNLNSEVKIFIEHYKKIIEGFVMKDQEIVDLCRKIYRENKEAIDLIIQNNDEKSDIFNIFYKTVNERNDIKIIDTIKSKKMISFFPNKIQNIDKLMFGKKNQLVVFLNVVINNKKPLYIEVVVREANENSSEKRENLMNYLIQKMNLKKFNGDPTWSYSPSVTLIEYDEYRNMEDEETVKKFLSDRLDKINYINLLRDALNEWKY